MVNLNNFFGAVANPDSNRQRAIACKAQGLVLDRDTKECRSAARRGRASAGGPTVAQLRSACKAQGLVLDSDTKECRASNRGVGLEAARAKRASNRGSAATVAQLRAACKARGLVLDRGTKDCRASNRGAGLEAARAKRASNRGPTQKDMAAMCKGQGLVFDRGTKECRPKKVRGSANDDNLFSMLFGVPSDARPGIIYSPPASTLTSPDFGALGPVTGPVTGAASFMLRSSTVTPAMQKSLGISMPKYTKK